MKINIQKLTEENSKQEKHTSKLNGIWQHLSRGIIKLNLLSNPARKTQVRERERESLCVRQREREKERERERESGR